MKNITIHGVAEYAISCHNKTNHTYDGCAYSVHLSQVYGYAMKYSNLLKDNESDLAFKGCWVHDVIEDCRQTYNDVKEACGIEVAEIAYALTNEKGKNRKERANSKYYEGIRNTPCAQFVKICDRLANATYSKQMGSRMIEAYRKEMPNFKKELYSEQYKEMFDELESILAL